VEDRDRRQGRCRLRSSEREMTDIKHLDAGKLNVRRDGPELCLSSAAGSAMRRG
jgi:hypothetical protein